MKISRHILLLFVPLLWGCAKDDDGDSFPPEVSEEDDTYLFQEIRYAVDAAGGDGMTEKSRELPVIQFYNRTSVTQSHTIGPIRDEKEYVRFSADEIPPRTLEIGEEALIPIPNYLSSSGSLWHRTEKEVFAPNAAYSYPYDRSQTTETVGVVPDCKLETTHTVRYYETVVGYTAVFFGRETGKRPEITGKCTSSRIVGLETRTVLSTIE